MTTNEEPTPPPDPAEVLADALTQADLARAQLVAFLAKASGAAVDLTRARANLGDQLLATQRTLDVTAEDLQRARLRILELEQTHRRTLFGAGGGNLDRTTSGIELDRRYYGAAAADLAKSILANKANAGAGILTWPSFKCPFGWGDMANGRGNSWFTARTKALADSVAADDAIDELWLSIHHEPEGDEPDEELWRGMQDTLSRLVPGGIEGPLKYILTTTGWNQEFNVDRVPAKVDWEANLFPTGAPIYAIAYDAPYNKFGFEWSGGAKTTKMDKSWTDPDVYVDKLADRAASLGVHAAIGECGFSDEAFAKDPTWLDKVFDRAIERGLLGVAYFDTPLNSSRSWWLGEPGSPKRAHFEQLVAARRA